MRNVLALDLGTNAGFAFGYNRESLIAKGYEMGTKNEIAHWGKSRLSRRCDPRVVRFFDILEKFTPGIVVFEDVQFASSTYQVQLWASFRGAIWCRFGSNPNIVIECVPTGTLKKFATGHGNATKEMMENSLFRQHPEWKSAKLTDDAIDALWLWYWAEQHLNNL